MLAAADRGAGAELIVAERLEPLVRMQGHETFTHAVFRMSQATLDALALAGVTLSDIDLFVYHQANERILWAVGEELGVDDELVVDCIARFGNTSAATLPLALAHEGEGRLSAGDRVLLGAFGAGVHLGCCGRRVGMRAQRWRVTTLSCTSADRRIHRGASNAGNP